MRMYIHIKHMYARALIYAHAHTQIYIKMHMHKHEYAHAHILNTCAYRYTCTHIENIFMYMHIHTIC